MNKMHFATKAIFCVMLGLCTPSVQAQPAKQTLRSKEAMLLIKVFDQTVDLCNKDVNHRNLSYARSEECRKLGQISQRLVVLAIEHDTYETTMELMKNGMYTAWASLAVSNGLYRKEPPLFSIW